MTAHVLFAHENNKGDRTTLALGPGEHRLAVRPDRHVVQPLERRGRQCLRGEGEDGPRVLMVDDTNGMMRKDGHHLDEH